MEPIEAVQVVKQYHLLVQDYAKAESVYRPDGVAVSVLQLGPLDDKGLVLYLRCSNSPIITRSSLATVFWVVHDISRTVYASALVLHMGQPAAIQDIMWFTYRLHDRLLLVHQDIGHDFSDTGSAAPHDPKRLLPTMSGSDARHRSLAGMDTRGNMRLRLV